MKFNTLLHAVLLVCLSLPSAQLLAQSDSTESTTESSSAGTGEIIFREISALRGDTFPNISRREMGSSLYAAPIAEFNNLSLNATLKADQTIRIPIHVPSRGESALVVFLKGEVLRGGEQIPRDDEILAGETITTGSDGFISIEFSNGTVINLQPDTEVTLNRLNCLPNDNSCFIDLEADAGTVHSDVDTREDQSTEYRITTPYASAAVRGTVFDTIADESTLVVGVTEGAILMTAAEQEVDLDSGFGSITRAGDAPGQPVALLPPPVFQNVPARVADGDTLTWWALTDVKTYGGVLSNDSAGVPSRPIPAGLISPPQKPATTT